jgi:predicted ABC-type ATPase
VAVLCDLLRRRWAATGQTFTFETVMSSADKLDLLREANRAGYRTYLYFVCTNDPMINRARIVNRVSEGGHDVPADKIAARYERSLNLLPDAIALCSRSYLFDNSEQSHRFIAEFEGGKLLRITEPLPPWFVKSSLSRNALPGAGEDTGKA